MTKFKVSLEWTAHTTIEVEAESLDEAMLKAKNDEVAKPQPSADDLHCYVDYEQSLMENMDPEPMAPEPEENPAS